MNREATQLTPLSPHPALLLTWRSEKTLAISDLHIGWELALAAEGVHVPTQTGKLLDRLKGIVAEEKPDRLLVLGDVKHAIAKIEPEEWRDVPDFFEESCRIVPKVQVILGNHDGNLEALLPEAVEVIPPQGLIIGDVGLFHGNTWPDIKMLGCRALVVGHVHPVVVFRDPMGFRITRQVWVQAPCDAKLLSEFVLKRHNAKPKANEDPQDVLKARFGVHLKTENLLIMPSFNDFLGGQAINSSAIIRQRRFQEFIGPVLRSGSVKFEPAEIYLLDGTFLGSLGRLRRLG